MNMNRATFTKKLALFTAGCSIVMAGAMVFVAARGAVTEAAVSEVAAQPASVPGNDERGLKQTRKGAGA